MGELFTCTDQGEYLQIRTPYLYPNGDIIDLFCKSEGDTVTVTDLAETTGWLRMRSLSARRSPNQNRLIQDAGITHGVEFYQGMLQARCRPGDDLAAVINRVGQAALRVSDLWFTLRYRVSQSITEEVADYLDERRLEYDRSKRLVGRSMRYWDVDFHVRAPNHSSLVYVLSTGNRAAAQRVTDHVVAAWYDLSDLAVGREPLHFVSLVDDIADVWREEEFQRLEPLSTVALWSRPDEFVKVLVEQT